MIHFVHLFSGLCPLLVGLVTIVAALMGFALMFSGLIVLFL